MSKIAIRSADNPPLTLPPIGFLRQSQLLMIVPVSPAQLWRMIGAGTFPAPVKLSPRVTAWEVAKVRQWIETRAAEAVEAA